MPPTTSPLFRLRLSTLGEDLNSWGDPNLNNALKLLEEGAKGVLSIAVTGDLTLTADNYVSNQYRRGALILTAGAGLAAPFVVTLPPIPVVYRIANQTGFAITVKTASGPGVALRAGRIVDVICDGTNCLLADPTLDKINPAVAAVNLNGQKITGLAAGSADTDAANTKQVNDVVAAVAANANAAQTSASNAATSENNAAAYAARLSGTSATSNTIGTGAKSFTTQAGKFFDAGNWLKISSAANPANYFHGQSTGYSGTSLTVNVTNTGGSGTFTDWVIGLSGTQGSQGLPGLVNAAITPKSANYTVANADRGALIDCTGSFTLSFTAAATLGAGFTFYVRSKTGAVTIPTSDGVTNWLMYPGEVRQFFTDGTNWFSVVLHSFYQVFTASGSMVWPPGYSLFEGLHWGGGGGGGGGSNNPQGGGGGGGGACVPITISASQIAIGGSISVTIAAGGAGSSTNTSSATNGGNTTLGALSIAYGGAGAGANPISGGGGGALGPGGTGGSQNTAGSPGTGGWGGAAGITGAAGSGASSVYGGGSGASGNPGAGTGGGISLYGGSCGWAGGTSGGAGGTSYYSGGAGGAGGATGANGSSGLAPGGGGGGGGSNLGTVGGTGGRGELRIWGVV